MEQLSQRDHLKDETASQPSIGQTQGLRRRNQLDNFSGEAKQKAWLLQFFFFPIFFHYKLSSQHNHQISSALFPLSYPEVCLPSGHFHPSSALHAKGLSLQKGRQHNLAQIVFYVKGTPMFNNRSIAPPPSFPSLLPSFLSLSCPATQIDRLECFLV